MGTVRPYLRPSLYFSRHVKVPRSVSCGIANDVENILSNSLGLLGHGTKSRKNLNLGNNVFCRLCQ